jgi:hypothetical protein
MWWTLVHAVMTRQLPYKVVNVLASWETVSFSRTLPHIVSSLDANHNPDMVTPIRQTSVADEIIGIGVYKFTENLGTTSKF